MATLYYYHDPMCSWCWGYRPCAQRLFAELPGGVERINVLGGLAPDSDEPMPAALREAIVGHWRRIESMLGTRFNYDFWTRCEPRRSTYPACRAVIAAAGQDREEQMILAIQEAYYLEARNPSDVPVLVSLAEQLSLDTGKFTADLRSSETEEQLQRQIRFTRASPVSGLPSLGLEHAGELVPVPVDYEDHEATLRRIAGLLA